MRIGLIGIIEEALRQDFCGALARVAEIGYEGLEFGLATLQPSLFRPFAFSTGSEARLTPF